MDDQDEPSLLRRARAGTRVVQTIGPWLVQLQWPRDAEQGGPWAVTIVPGPDATEADLAGGLGSGVLRRIDFQAAADEWRRIADRQAEHDERWNKRQTTWLRELAAEGITDHYLAALSRVYAALVMQGDRNVTAKLADFADKRPETIRTHLKEARKRELLTATGGGRAGGRLTNRAREILGMPTAP